MTALFSPQYLKWQELAKIFSVNKNWWQALSGLLSRSESSRRLPPFTGSVAFRCLKDVEGDTTQNPKWHPQLVSNKWPGFITNRWPSSASFERFLLNASQGIFQGAQASPALLPRTDADLSWSGVGWHQLHLHGGAGGMSVDLGCVPALEWIYPGTRPPVLTHRLPGSWTCWSSLPADPPFPMLQGFVPKASGVEREQSAPVSPFRVELSQS